MPEVEGDRARIYYETHGDPEAPALVLGHGAGGNRLIWWQQVPFFARSHRVIVFDHRSFGRSACAPEDFAPRHFAADVLRVLEHAGVDRFAYVGQSMGGWTGMALALEQRERLRALVLCGTPGGLWTPGVPGAMGKIGERIGQAGVEANAALAPDFPRREPALAHLYAQISALNAGVAPSALGTLFEPEARIDPARLTGAGWDLPTLVVAGGRDLLFPIEVMREVAAAIPGASLEEFPSAGHSTYFEEPARFNEIVGEFLAKHG